MSKFVGKSVSEAFARYRPIVPDNLMEKIVKFTNQKLPDKKIGTCLDIGCGTGLSTRRIREYLSDDALIIGIDNSASQISLAKAESPATDNIQYRVHDISDGFPIDNIDLITCVQSAHWFDLPTFFRHCDEHLTSGGVIAIAGYPLVQPKIPGDPETSRQLYHLTAELHDELTTNGYWQVNRSILTNRFKNIDLPYKEDQILLREDESIYLEQESTMKQFFDYILTWSGLRAYFEENPEGQLFTNFQKRFNRVLPKEDVNLKIVYLWFLLMFRKP